MERTQNITNKNITIATVTLHITSQPLSLSGKPTNKPVNKKSTHKTAKNNTNEKERIGYILRIKKTPSFKYTVRKFLSFMVYFFTFFLLNTSFSFAIDMKQKKDNKK
jgi:hypothetical protein